MKIELRDFQDAAVGKLLMLLKRAKRNYWEQNGKEPQAVVLSAPTGSGKTVITAALIEAILQGRDDFPAEPDAVFLWLSDQPELNEQSKARIADVIDQPRHHELVLVTTDFDRERFEGGKLYFLNTQKLGKDKLLTGGKGDNRHHSIWDTISNTAAHLKDRFYLIVDEAHRGARLDTRQENVRKSILQKFMLGSEGEIPAIDLVLGVSATPQRFQELLAAQVGQRTPHNYEVPPEHVRQSGLLKDRIVVYHPDARASSEYALLAEAAREWLKMREAWRAYCVEQNMPEEVKPALVVQVEDGSGTGDSRTDLDQVVRTLDAAMGGLQMGEIVHCFQHDAPITKGGIAIPKMEASRIQHQTQVKVVLFKMALTTGWDCPRAEVMMSFRAASDHTLIAQLIGRMVRTPLARRIEGRELLNSVSLYLPRFDAEGVKAVISRLKTDPDAVPPIDVEDGAKLVVLKPTGGSEAALQALSGLPTYRVERLRKLSNVRRMMRLARLLTASHDLDADALDGAKRLVIETLDARKAANILQDPGFEKKVREAGEIPVQAVTVEQGTWKELPTSTLQVKLDDASVEQLFERAGARIGEGLHLEYWQVRYRADDPNEDRHRVKLEVILLLQQPETWKALEDAAQVRLDELFKRNRVAIKKLESAEQERYNEIHEQAKEPEALTLALPSEMMVMVDKTAASGFARYAKHLYAESAGEYWADLNGWEQAVIAAEIARDDVAGWLRNTPNKAWALALPYELQGEVRAMYPDFLVVRKDGEGMVVDILEPHSSNLADSYAKAKGLAQFAAKHGKDFGRIELIRIESGKIQQLNLAEVKWRKAVLQVDSNAALSLLFSQLD